MNQFTTHAGRLMSYAMTKDPILQFEKLVTRRDGWLNLKVGEIFWAVEKGMGLKRGEKVQRLALLQCVGNRRERLYRMIKDKEYGRAECILEGFPHLSPAEFVEMYVKAKRGRHAGDKVSRIEFRYLLKAGPVWQDHDKIKIPASVGICPSCDGAVFALPQDYQYLEDGTLSCSAYRLQCENQLILSGSDLVTKVFNYLDATFRFELE